MHVCQNFLTSNRKSYSDNLLPQLKFWVIEVKSREISLPSLHTLIQSWILPCFHIYNLLNLWSLKLPVRDTVINFEWKCHNQLIISDRFHSSVIHATLMPNANKGKYETFYELFKKYFFATSLSVCLFMRGNL